ncbi:MAG TPA: pre-peptidase C-terminal domain-containing protein, partial [Phototrophicaceae bacterium]|nr:pre-peptidase C-terminal domain-containing protein [Phototrophicaceae bacterium]
WVTITLNSEAFDPLLIVEDSDGNEIARDDDSGGNSNSSLFLPVTNSETYTLKVTSFGGSGRGDFALSVEAVEADALKSGESTDTTFDDETAKYFQFDAKQGETYNIQVSTDEDAGLDTRLTLKDTNGADVATDDDNGAGLDPLIRRVTVPADGTYAVVLASSSGDALTGDVSVSLEATEALPLSDKPQQVTLDEDLNLEVMTYEVETPGRYEITVNTLGESSYGFTVEVHQNDVTVAYASISGVKNTLDFDLTESGTLTIDLSAFLYEANDYEVTLIPVK